MTGAEGAAEFFAENPLIDAVLATSDGNVWPLGELNKAEFHAAKNGLEPPEELGRSDEGMSELIHVANLVITARQSRIEASRGVTQETPPPAPVVPPTYEEARQALATALGIEDLTGLEPSYTVEGVTLYTIDALIATWMDQGMDVATWKALNAGTRASAIEAKYEIFFNLL